MHLTIKKYIMDYDSAFKRMVWLHRKIIRQKENILFWFLPFNTNRDCPCHERYLHAATYTLASQVLKRFLWENCLLNSSASEGLGPIVLQGLLLLLITKYWTILTLNFLFSFPALPLTVALLQPASLSYNQRLILSISRSKTESPPSSDCTAYLKSFWNPFSDADCELSYFRSTEFSLLAIRFIFCFRFDHNLWK